MKNARGSISLPIALALGALGLLLLVAVLTWPIDAARSAGSRSAAAAPTQTAHDLAAARSNWPSRDVAAGSDSSRPAGTELVGGGGGPNAGQTLSRSGQQSGSGLANGDHSERSSEPAGRTQIVAELDGDGSDFVLLTDTGADRHWSGVAEMQAAVLSAGTPADVKQDILADMVPLFATDGEAISFLRTLAADSHQPEEVRVDAVSKLADFGLQHVESFAASESAAIQEEVDLIKRLEDYRRQEGLPAGSVRSGFQ